MIVRRETFITLIWYFQAMKTNKIRIAVAGAGIIGVEHLERLHASPRCEIVAIVDPTDQSIETAKTYQAPHFAELVPMLDAVQPDGVILATPNQLHAEQAKYCLSRHIPVLIEKPLAHTLEEAERLYEYSLQFDCPALVGHHRSYSAIMAQAKRLIDEGVIGTPVGILGSALFYKPDRYYAEGPWRTQKGGGPVLLNLIHEIGNLRFLFGDIERVQAMASNRIRHFEVEDTCAITMQFKNGALGTFLLSDTAASPKSWEQTAGENKSYAHYPEQDCYHVTGTKGSLSIPSMKIHRYDDQTDPSWWNNFQVEQKKLEEADPLLRQIDHFCDVIEGKATPVVSIRDGLENLKIVNEVMRESANDLA